MLVTSTHSTFCPRYLDISRRLPNGITYWVNPSQAEPGEVLPSAAVNVGSMEEKKGSNMS